MRTIYHDISKLFSQRYIKEKLHMKQMGNDKRKENNIRANIINEVKKTNKENAKLRCRVF